jgi:hypothetical protein
LNAASAVIGTSSLSAARTRDPAAMPLQALQRPNWNGTLKELGDLFRLQKNRCTARAVLFTHQLGFEVRLLVGAQLEVVQTQVCRSQDEVLSTGEQWKAAMTEKGWQP